MRRCLSAFGHSAGLSAWLLSSAAWAQSASPAARDVLLAPDPPAVVRREEDGRVAARGVRIAEPIDLDGRLTEDVYQSTLPMDGFLQQEPNEGAQASEKTEAWIFFDDRNLYVSARCWDSHPERDVITEMRRDQNNITQNESFTVVFDTFLDRRNGFFFQTSPLGAIRDQAVVDDVLNVSWNTVWDVRTGRFDGGWTLEMSIPFKSLRYPGPGPQVWGVNFRRVVKWKNEYAYLGPMPASFGTGQAIGRMAQAATLYGVETPSRSMNLELKPYAVTSVTTDKTIAQPFANNLKGAGGFDFKYGLTRSLIADVTVNTDFAQVEEDLQQVNLTRFSLFFPEKRDFFLEGQGIFAFGGVGSGNGTPGDVPVLFFSRSIGLNKGQEVPVLGGARLTGRSGRYSVGALNIETGHKASASAVATNFSTLRVKRDVLRRSNVGLIATHRSAGVSGVGSNAVLGVDGNFFLFSNVTANGYYARSETTSGATAGAMGGASSYRGTFEYAGDRYGFSGEHLLIGERFDAQTGYVRRTDFRRTFGEARFTPRPKRRALVRKFTFLGSLDHVTDARRTVVLNRQSRGLFQTEFQSSDQFGVEYQDNYELVPKDFTISPGVVVPAGGYDSQNLRSTYSLGQQQLLSGRVALGRGSFYGGTRTEASYNGRIGLVPQFAFEPSLSFNWVDLPFGRFSAKLVTSRFVLTPTPRMSVSSLVQFNAVAHTVSSSVRLRWEYRARSELFVVYSDGRSTFSPAGEGLLNRSVAIKATRLLRF
jgi:hypothetical protein